MVYFDVRFLQPVTNHFENLRIGPTRVVKTWCVYKNDAGSVFSVVQNTNSLKLLSE